MRVFVRWQTFCFSGRIAHKVAAKVCTRTIAEMNNLSCEWQPSGWTRASWTIGNVRALFDNAQEWDSRASDAFPLQGIKDGRAAIYICMQEYPTVEMPGADCFSVIVHPISMIEAARESFAADVHLRLENKANSTIKFECKQ